MQMLKTLDSISDQREKSYILDHQKRYRETIHLATSLVKPPAKILEIGALFGHISISLSQLGYSVSAVDIEEEYVKYHDRMASFNVEERICDIETEIIPFPDEYFDLIILSEVLEHINPLSAHFAMYEISMALRRNGYLILSTPNLFNIGSRLRMLFGHKFLCPEHTREYSREETEQIISGDNPFSRGEKLEILKTWYSLSVDGYFSNPNKSTPTRIARTVLYPLKLVYPRFRGTMFFLVTKKWSTG